MKFQLKQLNSNPLTQKAKIKIIIMNNKKMNKKKNKNNNFNSRDTKFNF